MGSWLLSQVSLWVFSGSHPRLLKHSFLDFDSPCNSISSGNLPPSLIPKQLWFLPLPGGPTNRTQVLPCQLCSLGEHNASLILIKSRRLVQFQRSRKSSGSSIKVIVQLSFTIMVALRQSKTFFSYLDHI